MLDGPLEADRGAALTAWHGRAEDDAADTGVGPVALEPCRRTLTAPARDGAGGRELPRGLDEYPDCLETEQGHLTL